MATDATSPDATGTPTAGHAGRRRDLLRLSLSALYVLGAVVHVVLGLRTPEAYEAFADRALVDAYASLWQSLVVPNLAVLQPLVVAFELAVGLALLWRGRAVRAAHGAGAAFQVALVLSGPWGPVNAVLAAIHVAAARASHPRSLVAALRR